ncbi:MAG: DUF5625 family protein [Pseudomonadota bacterium]
MPNRYIYLCLALLGLHFLGHHLFVEHYSVWPLKGAPISLDPAGKISEQIEIRMPQIYDLTFSFSREGHEFEKLKNLIGGVYPSVTGVGIPVKWALVANNSNKVVLQNQKQTKRGSSWSKKEVWRFIDHIEVTPGFYTLEVEVLGSVPEFQGVNTSIQVSYSSKNGSTWHIGYMWWGMLFNYFVAPFLSIILLCKLQQNHNRRLLTRNSRGNAGQ